MNKNWLFRMAAILVMIFFLPLYTGAAEEMMPPSPEPPNANMAKPTPAPTEIPTETLIDHINQPKLYPRFYFAKGRKLLEIWIPNIKDADAAILTYDGEVWMIDCGDVQDGERCAAIFRQIGISRVDRMFNSHPHHDHLNGLAVVDEAAKVGELLICFSPTSTDSAKRMTRVTEQRGIPVAEYHEGDRFTMGDGAVELLILQNAEGNFLDMNNRSAVTKITYGQRTILFTADMEQPGQEVMLNRVGPEVLKCDIIKYPHHAKSDMFSPFYDATGARLAVVTSVEGRGDNGQIALAERGLPAVYTYVEGMFTHLVTDGEYWLCERVPAKE